MCSRLIDPKTFRGVPGVEVLIACRVRVPVSLCIAAASSGLQVATANSALSSLARAAWRRLGSSQSSRVQVHRFRSLLFCRQHLWQPRVTPVLAVCTVLRPPLPFSWAQVWSCQAAEEANCEELALATMAVAERKVGFEASASSAKDLYTILHSLHDGKRDSKVLIRAQDMGEWESFAFCTILSDPGRQNRACCTSLWYFPGLRIFIGNQERSLYAVAYITVRIRPR